MISQAEAMALAVLRGDMAAARALADHLMEEYNAGSREIPPVKKLVVNRKNLRAVFRTYESLGADVLIDVDQLRSAYEAWVDDGGCLILIGCHIELYELENK